MCVIMPLRVSVLQGMYSDVVFEYGLSTHEGAASYKIFKLVTGRQNKVIMRMVDLERANEHQKQEL